MSDDSPFVILVLVGAVLLFIGGFGFGSKLTAVDKMDNCMQYHKTMPLQDIEPLCKKILGVAK